MCVHICTCIQCVFVLTDGGTHAHAHTHKRAHKHTHTHTHTYVHAPQHTNAQHVHYTCACMLYMISLYHQSSPVFILTPFIFQQCCHCNSVISCKYWQEKLPTIHQNSSHQTFPTYSTRHKHHTNCSSNILFTLGRPSSV